MVLRNGKFYDDKNNEVPPQIGNAEQIALLKEAEVKPNKVEFKCTYIKYNVEMSFGCEVCNATITDEVEQSDTNVDLDYISNDNICDDFIYRPYKCTNCGTEYQIEQEIAVKQ